MSKSMKRIHKVTIKHIPDESYQLSDTTDEHIGIKAVAEVSFPISEMHTPKCIEINEKRAQYACECSSGDSLIQYIKSGGVWGLEADTNAEYLKELEQEQLEELRRVLHQIGFSTRAISAAFRDIQ